MKYSWDCVYIINMTFDYLLIRSKVRQNSFFKSVILMMNPQRRQYTRGKWPCYFNGLSKLYREHFLSWALTLASSLTRHKNAAAKAAGHGRVSSKPYFLVLGELKLELVRIAAATYGFNCWPWENKTWDRCCPLPGVSMTDVCVLAARSNRGCSVVAVMMTPLLSTSH